MAIWDRRTSGCRRTWGLVTSRRTRKEIWNSRCWTSGRLGGLYMIGELGSVGGPGDIGGIAGVGRLGGIGGLVGL